MQRPLSIVMPARNDAPSLRAAVEQLMDQQGIDIEKVVIAVGPSADDTYEVANSLAEEFESVVVVDNPTGRTPNALNAAIEHTSSALVARVDARSRLPARYFAHALETMDEEDAGNVGAIQHPVGKTPRQRAIAAAMSSRLGSGGAAYRGARERQPVDTAYLGFFKRDALVEVGGYDEVFTRNQDAELNLRLNKAGHQVWLDPRLVVDYLPRSSLRSLASQYWQYGWWRQRTIRKHGAIKLRQLGAPVIVTALVASIVLAVLVSPWMLVVPMLYALLVLTAALAGSGPTTQRLVAAAALVTMHVSWGAGFLCSAVASLLRIHKE